MSKIEIINVAVHEISPLVMKDNGNYLGFEIRLWEKIARALNLKYKYIDYKFDKIFNALKNNEAGVAMAGITINEEREKVVDFSHRTFDSGLSILVSEKGTKMGLAFSLKTLITQGFHKILLLLLGFVFIAGHIIWLVERGSQYISSNYFPGVFEAFWWSIVTVSTVGYGDVVPVTWLGRLIGVVVILLGLSIFGLYIAKISSLMTIGELKSRISSYRDLYKRTVATKKGTTSVETLNGLGVKVVEVEQMEDAYSLLEKEEVEAIVFDFPVLKHYVKSKGAGKVKLTGEVFEKQSYGFALPEGSRLREDINRVILHLRESGEYDLIYKEWFGV